MNNLVKFPKGHEEGDEDDKEFKRLWHLKAFVGDGEFTACGLAWADGGYEIKEKSTKKGGITCDQCLETVKFYKSILI